MSELEASMFRMKAQAVQGTFDIGGESKVSMAFREAVCVAGVSQDICINMECLEGLKASIFSEKVNSVLTYHLNYFHTQNRFWPSERGMNFLEKDSRSKHSLTITSFQSTNRAFLLVDLANP